MLTSLFLSICIYIYVYSGIASYRTQTVTFNNAPRWQETFTFTNMFTDEVIIIIIIIAIIIIIIQKNSIAPEKHLDLAKSTPFDIPIRLSTCGLKR